MATDNLNITRDSGVGGARGDPAPNEFTREVQDQHRVGRSGLQRGGNRRLWRYDRDQGAANATLKGGTDKADRTPIEEAARLMHTIHVAFQVDKQMEGYLYDFDSSMFICYTLNGGSQFTPTERVQFYVGTPSENGYTDAYSFSTVYSILGVEFRRFFRTYANELIEACRQAIYRCDFNDEEAVEKRKLLLLHAQARGVTRYPHLCADCTDAATDLSVNEYHAVLSSKQVVLANTANSVDKRSSAFPMRSADNFDSSVGASIRNENDIHATRSGYYN